MYAHLRLVVVIWIMISARMVMAQEETAVPGVLEYAATNPPTGSLSEAELNRTPLAQKKALVRPLLKEALRAEDAGNYPLAAILQLRCVMIFEGHNHGLIKLAEYLEQAGDLAGAIGVHRQIIVTATYRPNKSRYDDDEVNEAKTRVTALTARLKLTEDQRKQGAMQARGHADALLTQGEHFLALLLYRKADELAPDLDSKWNIAICHDRWRYLWREITITAYKDFLDSVPVEHTEIYRERIAEAKARIGAIQQQLANSPQ